MNYLKLVNIPISIFQDSKYGAPNSGSKIPWSNLGFNTTIVSTLAVQYSTTADDSITYLPISDDIRLNTYFSKISDDTLILNSASDKICTTEIVSDDRTQWLLDRDTAIQEQQ